MAIITRQELEDAAADAQTLEDFINGAADLNGNGQLTTRLGRTLQTLAKLVEVTQSTLDPNAVNAQLATKATITYVDQQIATRAATSHSHTLGSITGGGNMSRLGTVAHTITDWNDANENGWYMANPTATANGPNVPNVWFIGYVIVHNSLWSTQYVHAFTADNDDNSYAYRRDKNNGGWTDWVRVYETADEIDELIAAKDKSRVIGLPAPDQSIGSYRSGGVVMADNSLRMWGYAGNGQLGQGTFNHARSAPIIVAFPPEVTPDLTVVKWVRSTYSNWVLFSNGDVYSWGYNQSGALGHGNTSVYHVPTKIAALDSVNVVDMVSGSYEATGYQTIHFLTDTGALYGCGYNGYGQVGNGNTSNQLTPVQVGASQTWAKIFATGCQYTSVYAITTSGSLYSWGFNNLGQLGNGNTINQSTPQFINFFGGISVSKVSATIGSPNQYGHAVLLLTNGKVYTMGYGGYGQLGNASTSNSTVPFEVTSLGTDNADVYAAGGEYGSTYVLKQNNGGVHGAGYNGYGQLSRSGTTQQTTFGLAVGSNRTGTTIRQVLPIGSASYTSLVILYEDGLIYSCGYNGSGQLGRGTTTTLTTLGQVYLPGQFLGDKLCVVGYSSETGYGILTKGGQYLQTGYGGDSQIPEDDDESSSVPFLVQL